MSFFREIVDQEDECELLPTLEVQLEDSVTLAMPHFVAAMDRYACGKDACSALETIAAKLALQSKDGTCVLDAYMAQVAAARLVIEKAERAQQHNLPIEDDITTATKARLVQTAQRLTALHVFINRNSNPQQHPQSGDACDAFEAYLETFPRRKEVSDEFISLKHLRWLVAGAGGLVTQRELLQDALAKVEAEYKTYTAVARELLEQQCRLVDKRAHLIQTQADSPLSVGFTARDAAGLALETARWKFEAARGFHHKTAIKLDEDIALLQAKINQLKSGYVSSSSSRRADCQSGAYLSDEQPDISTDAQLATDSALLKSQSTTSKPVSWKKRILRFFRCGAGSC